MWLDVIVSVLCEDDDETIISVCARYMYIFVGVPMKSKREIKWFGTTTKIVS